MNSKRFFDIFRAAFRGSLNNNATLKASALTFFIILPLPSLLFIVLVALSQLYGSAQATQQIIQLISGVAGPTIADLFSQLLSSSISQFYSLESAVLIVGSSVGGAIGTFLVLRNSLDAIWGVEKTKKQPLFVKTKHAVIPFFVLLALGFFVFFWTVFSTMVHEWICLTPLTGANLDLTLNTVQGVLSFVLGTFLFAVIYKRIPTANMEWSDVTLASILTGGAFTGINYFFGFFVKYFATTTLEGAAGALLFILLWIFSINQLLLFGAELSRAYSYSFGTNSTSKLSDAETNNLSEIEEEVGFSE